MHPMQKVVPHNSCLDSEEERRPPPYSNQGVYYDKQQATAPQQALLQSPQPMVGPISQHPESNVAVTSQPLIVSTQHVMASMNRLTPNAMIVCPNCKCAVNTRVDYQPTTSTHLCACLLCLIFLPCAFLPYCIDSCQESRYYCSRCNLVLASNH